MIYGILLSATVLLFVLIAALLIILWAVPVIVTGRAELCHNAPTLIGALCIEWGILSLQTWVPEEDSVRVVLLGRTIHRIPLGEETAKPPETAEREKETGQETEKETEQETGGTEKKTSPDITGIADAILSHIGAIIHQIAIDHLRASVRFGLGDAALTGETFGLLMTIRGMLMATGGKVSLAAQAEFHEQIVEGDVEGEIRVTHPLALLPPVVRIIRHPAVWKMVRNR